VIVVRAKRAGAAADEVGSAISAVPQQGAGPEPRWCVEFGANEARRRSERRGEKVEVPNIVGDRDIGASFQRIVLCGVALFCAVNRFGRNAR